MSLFDISPRMFEVEIKGERSKRILEGILTNIVEVEARRKGENRAGYIIGTRNGDIILRATERFEKGKKYEFRFTSERGIIMFETNVKDEIEGSNPPLLILESPNNLKICERRRHMRIRVNKSSEVIIKRDSGYALFCSLLDISLGEFSVYMSVKDRMIEYFLPMLNEEVGFTIRIKDNKKLELDGRAILKHYSLGADGKYKAGFNFSKVDRRTLQKIISLATKKEKQRSKK
jgi:c-di-GMP-binding flagellar brake protein YcgR